MWFVGGLSVFHFYLISTNQTTYENFRYRYDRRENPYNKGIFSNFKEVFFSKIPSSAIDFQGLVLEDEHLVVEPTNLDDVEGVTSSKEKIDIEMGTKLVEEGGISIPEILRNLSFDHFEDDIRSKERELNGSDPSIFVPEQESKDSPRRSTRRDEKADPEPHLFLVEQELIDSPRSSTANNGVNGKDNVDDVSGFT